MINNHLCYSLKKYLNYFSINYILLFLTISYYYYFCITITYLLYLLPVKVQVCLARKLNQAQHLLQCNVAASGKAPCCPITYHTFLMDDFVSVSISTIYQSQKQKIKMVATVFAFQSCSILSSILASDKLSDSWIVLHVSPVHEATRSHQRSPLHC